VNDSVKVWKEELRETPLEVKLKQARSLTPKVSFLLAHVTKVLRELGYHIRIQLNDGFAHLNGFRLRINGNPHVCADLYDVHRTTHVVKKTSSVD